MAHRRRTPWQQGQEHSGIYSQKCIVEYCNRSSWVTRKIEFCGYHARHALTGLKPEIEERAQAIADSEIQSLHALLGAQERRIRELEGERENARAAKAAEDGTVYYLRVGGYIKIGWASDLAKRMRSYAPDTVLLATEPGTRGLEKRRHKQFAAHRTHGREWYAMVPPLMQHIDRTANEHGKPDPVAFSAQPVTVPEPRPFKSFVGGNYRGNGMVGERRAQ